jgi:hypothetical protein
MGRDVEVIAGPQFDRGGVPLEEKPCGPPDQEHPLVRLLIIREDARGGVAQRDDPLDSQGVRGQEGLDDLGGQLEKGTLAYRLPGSVMT